MWPWDLDYSEFPLLLLMYCERSTRKSQHQSHFYKEVAVVISLVLKVACQMIQLLYFFSQTLETELIATVPGISVALET